MSSTMSPILKVGALLASIGLVDAAHPTEAPGSATRFIRCSSTCQSWPVPRRCPAVHRGAVLNESNVRAQWIACEVLLAGVAPELAGAERGVPADRQHALIAWVSLRPPGKAREIVVSLNDDVDAKCPCDLVCVGDAIKRLDHDDHEHVVVVGVLITARHVGPHRSCLSGTGAATAKRRESRVARGFERLMPIANGRKNQADRADIGRFLNG